MGCLAAQEREQGASLHLLVAKNLECKDLGIAAVCISVSVTTITS